MRIKRRASLAGLSVEVYTTKCRSMDERRSLARQRKAQKKKFTVQAQLPLEGGGWAMPVLAGSGDGGVMQLAGSSGGGIPTSIGGGAVGVTTLAGGGGEALAGLSGGGGGCAVVGGAGLAVCYTRT